MRKDNDEMKTPIIGFDFGNYNSFAAFISDLDVEKSRLGGMAQPLSPESGFPSAFFYSASGKIREAATLPWCGEKAVSTQAYPLKNRTRLLKRHLGEELVLDDRTFTYDEAIVQVAQYCIRKANADLKRSFLTQSDQISLSYPSTYTCAQRQRLIELMEKVTLEDGTPVKVMGTIAEPAAAALDYLAEFAKKDEDTTILTYDLGGGTFDLALVSAYPKGRQNSRGNTYYYDIINTRGLGDLGGSDFDKILWNMAQSKIREAGLSLKKFELDALEGSIETNKIELSDYEYTDIEFYTEEDYEHITITREEYEKAILPLVQKTIEETKKLLDDHPAQKPEVILLTGGASQTPLILRELEKALPSYAGKIGHYRPHQAIAFGAARFGAVEEDTDPVTSAVQQRTIYDLGDTCYEENGKEVFEVFIPKGTELPCESEFHNFLTRGKTQRYVRFSVYEAKRQDSDYQNAKEDYTEIMSGTLDLGRECPYHTKVRSRFAVDKMGCLTVEAFETENPSGASLTKTVELKNLS